MTAYIGNELEIFAKATNWKRYWRSRIKPFVKGDVLDVGAGIGATRKNLEAVDFSSWHALEPDPDLAVQIDTANCKVTVGTISAIKDSYDTILYIDVLEHIKEDARELADAAERLRPGGKLIVLAPAHQNLYSPLDEAVGHYRRYDQQQLTALGPETLVLERSEYLDSIGIIVSGLNSRLLKQQLPTERQIWFWDTILVPCAWLLDALTLRRLGKSLLMVWSKPHETEEVPHGPHG